MECRIPQPCLAELREVSVSYGGKTICEPVSFVLKQGEPRIALQGVNGCGKSSLLRLLMGQAVPHSGTVVLSWGVRVSYVGQETDVPVGTLADYARAQGVEEHRFKAILQQDGIFPGAAGKRCIMLQHRGTAKSASGCQFMPTGASLSLG